MTPYPARSLWRSAVAVALAVALQLESAAAQSGPEPAAADAVLEAMLDQVPRHRFDVDALLSSVPGADPRTLFELVRDETRLVPYVGMLRGSRGVLMDGLGNSLDRSVLLAELLRRTGIGVRLARGTLQIEQAASLAEQLSRAAGPSEVPSLAAHELSLAAAVGAEDAQPGQERWSNPIAASVDQQVAALVDLLGNRLADRAGVDRATMARALMDHWWVQFHAEGSWIDLDTALSGGSPGASLTGPVELWPVDPSQAAELAVPEAHWHRFSLNLLVERASGGSLNEVTALTADIVPALVIGTPIALQIIPLGLPDPAAALPDAGPIETLIAGALAAEAWSPVLMVGEGAILGERFDAVALAATDAPSTGGGLLGPLTEALTEASDAPSEDGELAAVFVDYVFSQPGAAEETIRRPILDLIGPAARTRVQDGLLLPGDWQPDEAQKRERVLALTERIEIVPQVAAFDPALRSAMVLEALRSLLAALQPDSDVAGVSPIPGAASLLAVLRRDWNPLAAEVLIDRINILTAHHRLARMDPTGRWAVEVGLDIVRNEVSPLPWTSLQPALLRLRQGVADTNAEAALLRFTATASNAGLLYSADLNGGGSWRVVASTDQLSAVLSDDAAARIRDALLEGDVAVVPEIMSEAGDLDGMPWWRITPATGTAIGIGPRGWGQSLVEYPGLNNPPLTLAEGLVDYGISSLVIFGLIFICEVSDLLKDDTNTGELLSDASLCSAVPRDPDD